VRAQPIGCMRVLWEVGRAARRGMYVPDFASSAVGQV
jgi:hypothetical protein